MMASYNHKSPLSVPEARQFTTAHLRFVVEEETKRRDDIKRKREQRILENKKIWTTEILPQWEKRY